MKSLLTRTLKYGLYTFLLLNSYVLQASEIPVTTQSEKAFVYFLQGRDKLENLELDSAAYYFDQAVNEDTSFSLAYLYSAITSKDTNKIKVFLSKAYQHSDTVSSGEKLLIDICASFLKYNKNDIKDKLKQLITEYPSDKRVYNLAGIYLSMMGEEKSAIEHFKTAIELDNGYCFAYNNLALLFLKRKDFKLALEANNKIKELLPTRSEPLCLQGKILLAMKNYSKALFLFDSIYKKDSINCDAIAYLGHINLILKHYDLSTKLYHKWELNAKSNLEKNYAKYFKALTYISQNKFDEARVIFENSDPKDVNWKIVTDNLNNFEPLLVSSKKNWDPFMGKSKEEILFSAVNDYEKNTSKYPFLMTTITFPR